MIYIEETKWDYLKLQREYASNKNKDKWILTQVCFNVYENHHNWTHPQYDEDNPRSSILTVGPILGVMQHK